MQDKVILVARSVCEREIRLVNLVDSSNGEQSGSDLGSHLMLLDERIGERK